MHALSSLVGVAFRYDGAATDTFSDLNLDISRGDRCCVVGDNGSGKSTLLQLLAGRLTPARGHVVLRDGATVALANPERGSVQRADAVDHVVCGDPVLHGPLLALRSAEHAATTDPRNVDAAMALAEAIDDWSIHDGWTREADAEAVLHRLGVPADRRRCPLDELSGGERGRVELARILASGADILLLDEPTEHLDLDGCAQLERLLGELPAAVVLVSHDRRLLESVATQVVLLQRGEAIVEHGSFVSFEQRRRDGEARAQREWEAGERRRIATERAAEAKLVQARSMLIRPDTGKPTIHFHYRARAARVERTAKTLRKRLEIQPPAEKPYVPPKAASLLVGDVERGPAVVARLRRAALGWEGGDDPIVLDGVDLEVVRGDHHALVGPNGVGKSTLLAALSGKLEPRSGALELDPSARIAVVNQQVDGLDPQLDAVSACVSDANDPELRRLVLRQLAAFRVRERTLQGRRVSELSAGTRRKVALVRALVGDVHLIVLDEPTNHLDLAARDTLAAALVNHPAAVVVATHDRALLDALGYATIDVRRWTTQARTGTIEEEAP